MWCVSRRRGEAIIAIVLAGLGAYWIVGAWVMPAGEFSVPGPGFIPTLVGSLLVLVAIGLLAAGADVVLDGLADLPHWLDRREEPCP